jgi:hypothetical protein
MYTQMYVHGAPEAAGQPYPLGGDVARDEPVQNLGLHGLLGQGWAPLGQDAETVRPDRDRPIET